MRTGQCKSGQPNWPTQQTVVQGIWPPSEIHVCNCQISRLTHIFTISKLLASQNFMNWSPPSFLALGQILPRHLVLPYFLLLYSSQLSAAHLVLVINFFLETCIKAFSFCSWSIDLNNGYTNRLSIKSD